jgi:predicted RecB family nuclease
MIISSPLFEAFVECPTKCWLRSRSEPSTGNSYSEWARLQNETYYDVGLTRLLTMFPESDCVMAPPISKRAMDATWRLAIDMRLRTNGLESRLQAVERIPSEGRRKSLQLIPYRFEFANKLVRKDKLLLAFDALLLSETIGRQVSLGKILHGGGYSTLKVNLTSLASEVRKRIMDIGALLAHNLPPDLVLNRHCGQCEYQALCHKQATERNDLSLLSGMSPKERERLHGKGLFTVTQLSYTFRPRRRRQELRGRQEKFHHSLRLATSLGTFT